MDSDTMRRHDGEDSGAAQVTVRVFSSLRPYLVERGVHETTLVVAIPVEGVTGSELAQLMELPVSAIEGVFVNHVVHGLGVVIRPGDRVAFVPDTTPGPHRFMLGLYRAGRDENA